MNPYESAIASVSDPLSEHTRRVRKSLLLSAVVSASMTIGGLFPEKISAFGLEFSQTDRTTLLWLFAMVVGYFCVSFCVAATSDFLSWQLSRLTKEWQQDCDGHAALRKQLLEDRELSAEDREALENSARSEGAIWRSAGYVNAYTAAGKIVGPVAAVRTFVEFVVPILAGIGALYLLISHALPRGP